jgi:DnaD/phage-associated family protein
MANFKGFAEGPTRLTPVPEAFFRHLLAQIDELATLKLAVFIFYRLEQAEGAFRYLRYTGLTDDTELLAALDARPAAALHALDEGLTRLLELNMLLEAEWQGEAYYFLNSPKGRAGLHAIQSGQWKPAPGASEPPAASQPVNIYRLYEENIGPLTPIMADNLKEAEDSFHADWIDEAIQIAVKNNKRNWRYIHAILERWQREGKHGPKEKQNRSDSAEDRRKYIEGEYSDFIEH